MTPVKSSNIKAVHHDPASGAFTVHFNSGAKWRYDDVPGHHHDAMVGADSPGSYFHQNIKGQYEGRKVDG